jgi:hypothetical protein
MMNGKYRLNDLNKKLRLEELEGEVWTLKKYVWGKIEINLNTVITEHGVLENKNLYTVIIRNFNAVAKTMRFVHRDTILYIKYIDSMDEKYLKILCEEIC